MNFDQLIEEMSEKYSIDKNLLKAIVHAESNFQPYAMRYESFWKYFYHPREIASKLNITGQTEVELQKFSYGLCQIMGSVAREHGFEDYLPKLLDPRLNLEYGCIHLKKLYQKYVNEAEVIAAYNAGSARYTDGGMLVNQRYVDRVYQFLLSKRTLIE